MVENLISLIVVLAIVISVALGYKTKINTGFFAISFAYIIGCFFLDLKASDVIAMWPIKIFFVIFAVSLFYNFAIENETLEKLSQYLLYKTRKIPHLLPYVIFFITTLLAGLGAGYFTVLAFMAPITLTLYEKTGLNKLAGAITVNYGALAGANFMTSGNGIIFKGLIEDTGYTENVYSYTAPIFIVSTIIPIILITISIILSSKNQKSRDTNLSNEKPEKFNHVQSVTLKLILTLVIIVLLPPILEVIFPGNEMIQFINSKMDVGLIAIVFTVIALLLRLGDQKAIIAKVPWNTLIMICGVGMLISVAIEAGTIDILASWVGTNIPALLVPIALAVIGGIMSFFSSTVGVVAPALFPIVPSIATATGLNPIALFASIIIGAQATSISPFSSGGSLILGSTGDKEKDKMFGDLMFKGVPLCWSAAIIFTIILAIFM